MTNALIAKRIERLAAGRCPKDSSILQIATGGARGGQFVFRCHHAWCDFEATSALESGAALAPLARCAGLLDPALAQLPQQTEGQRRGLMAADVVSLSLSRIAFVHRVETALDIGTDFHCELRDGDEPTGQFFNVQCKALPARDPVDKGNIAIIVRVTTARYWLIQPWAALLIVADPETGTLFWTDAKAQLTARTDEWREQGEVTLAVARVDAFACFAPPPARILELARASLRDLGTTLQERLHTERAMLRSLNRIGVDDSARNVSRRLEGGTAADIGILVDSVEAFRTDFAALIVQRIATYTSALRARVTDTFQKSKLISGPTYDYRSDSSYLDLVHRMAEADATCRPGNPPALDTLVSALRSVEYVHDQWWTLHEEVENEVNARSTLGPKAGFTSRAAAAAFWVPLQTPIETPGVGSVDGSDVIAKPTPESGR